MTTNPPGVRRLHQTRGGTRDCYGAKKSVEVTTDDGVTKVGLYTVPDGGPSAATLQASIARVCASNAIMCGYFDGGCNMASSDGSSCTGAQILMLLMVVRAACQAVCSQSLYAMVNADYVAAIPADPATAGATNFYFLPSMLTHAGGPGLRFTLSGGRRGSAGCLNSFNASTLIEMSDGTAKPIIDVEIDDEVQATDPETGETAAKKVTALIRARDKDLTDVVVVSWESQVVSTIHTTPHHPFWDATVGKWVDAAVLPQGHRLYTADGAVVIVRQVRTWRGDQTMYNLTVADIHTYYVLAGHLPILVHNCPDEVPSGANSRAWSVQPGFTSESTLKFHYEKHGAPRGVTMEQYNSDAVAWANSNPGRGYNATRVQLSDGSWGVKYTTPNGGTGGILDANKNVVSFWYGD